MGLYGGLRRNYIRRGQTLSVGAGRHPLVVNNSMASHYWLNLLPLCRDSSLQFYISEDDLASVSDRLHVQPLVVPCFLVFSRGYVVDWFPAPLPVLEGASDPTRLVRSVQNRLKEYG